MTGNENFSPWKALTINTIVRITHTTDRIALRIGPITIAKIQKGIVVDHIPAGQALLITQVLGLNTLARETGDIIAIGINFDSPSMKKKDIIKVENLSLTREMLNVVALIAPVATPATSFLSNEKVINSNSLFAGMGRASNASPARGRLRYLNHVSRMFDPSSVRVAPPLLGNTP